MEIPEIYEKTEQINLDKSPRPVRDIIFGASIPVLVLVLGYYGLPQLGEIRYRPWLFPPLQCFLKLFSDLSLLLLYPLYLFKKRKLGSPFGLPLPHSIFKEFLKSLFILFLVRLSTGLVINVIKLISRTESAPEVSGNALNNILFLIYLFVGFTLGPVCEEVFFRGFLYNSLKTRVSVVVATLIQGAFFGILHYPSLLYAFDYPKLLNAFEVFLLGIGLAIVYEKRKSLISAIFVHGTQNAIVLIPLLIVGLQNIHFPATN